MNKYAVHFTRIETRIVWAEDQEDAIDVALEIDPPDAKVIEATLNIEAEDAEDDAETLNCQHVEDGFCAPCVNAKANA